MADLNIYFLAVGRVQGEGIVVASHSNDSNVELSGVTQVIEQPTMNMQPGKHYSFDVGKKDSPSQAWHLISGTWNRFLYRDLIFQKEKRLSLGSNHTVPVVLRGFGLPQKYKRPSLDPSNLTKLYRLLTFFLFCSLFRSHFFFLSLHPHKIIARKFQFYIIRRNW